ncbi:MAG: hypothetical protein AB7O38_14985 [Pirellulaceae bacterium]
MSAVFEKGGIRFQYPENWSIAEEDFIELPQTVSLQVPQGGLWSLTVYEPNADPTTLLRETLDQMRKEYADLESSTIVEQLEGVSATGHEMYFYCLDFLVCARSLALRTRQGKVLLLLWQAEDRDFATYEPVFRAITVSLLRESPAA